MKTLPLLLITLLFSFTAHAQIEAEPDATPDQEVETSAKMTQEKMVAIIQELAGETEGTANNLGFTYDGVTIAMVSDVAADRMRLVSAVIEAKELSDEQIIATLVSNYHLALDARYAIGGGVLFSTYIHPLSPLTKQQLLSAVRQVATLSKTFGSTYTSGEMSFGVQAQEEKIDI